ncbi:MAG: 23S rRNA (pseudouridine(1915)-N(3))-methyltransferase RlmH [Clostridiales bacterium]|nr:23S rRNA (pseudouridine(1915)-N(3))-methyltransferase RlmH [Clostridiales bacterium]
MKIIVVCPGKLKDKWLKDGIDEYKKRLSRFATLDFIEVADCPDSVPTNDALKKEGELILSHIKPGEVVWAMDLGGENVTSEKLSQYLTSDIEKGGGTLKIVIGGSNGISPEVRARADRRICFGNITLTHLMTRLVLSEQLYRGFKIAKGEKYHK